MHIKELSWRDIYQKIFLLDWQGRQLLAACLICRQRGLVLAALAEGRETDGSLSFSPLPRVTELCPLLEEAVAAAELTLLPPPVEAALRAEHASRLTELAARYAGDPALEEVRSITLLDPHRQPLHPDIISVHIGRNGQTTEPATYPVLVEALHSPQLTGRLLADAPEPGLTAGAPVSFVIVRQPERDNRIICLCVLEG